MDKYRPPVMEGKVKIGIDGVPHEIRISRWHPNKKGVEYVRVYMLDRKWDVSDPDQLRCAIANGLRKSEPGRMWTLRELQQRIGHGVTEDMLRPAIFRMEHDGWLIVVRGKPRKDSLCFALIRP